ncbi:hypothetical protein PR003_g23586 [Phytophthora rubi]|uniref:Kazal-like domain-containing protein n=1 Tax=Phytophthora rubi TaxID=129364 RepID=A0A6A3NP82_9STRA|nr:hypothetical protein PR002_g22605 [Phytophthora rubi]KAE9047183.1 hypothetical protein PR001_g4318 [Phytophthora rubi]KAE9297104.1 hypothetical protein PR003_g23586 [Phytophthora rubi]
MKFAAVAVLASLMITSFSAISESGSTSCSSVECPKSAPSVCGSNGITYKNRCVFDTDNCTNGGSKWIVLHGGMCRRDEINVQN